MSGDGEDSMSEEIYLEGAAGGGPSTDQMVEESEAEGEEDGGDGEDSEESHVRSVRQDKKSKGDGKGRRKNVAFEFQTQDNTDTELFVKEMSQILKEVMKSADACLTGLAGRERKKERNSRLKKFHKAVVAVTEAKLTADEIPDIVDSVYNKMDMEKLANSGLDDDQFFELLEEFEENCNKEIKCRFENVKMDDVDKDDEYQEALEVLNKFVERKLPQPSTSQNCVNPPPVNIKVEEVEVECSEGLEAVTEFIPVRDPVTRRYFTDPYVNSVCGHVYEMSSISEIVTAGKKRCPYAGCTNTKPVKLSDMVKNKIMEQKIFIKIRSGELD